MISELAIMGLTTAAYRKIKSVKEHKEERKLMAKWLAAMIGAGIKNKDDKEHTMEIVDIDKKDYGFNCQVSIPFGLSQDKLESLKPIIETNLNCLCEITRDKFSPYTTVKVIDNPLNNLTYKLVETKPYELFLGYKFTGEALKLNMLEDSHLLIGGIRGSGKSRLQFIALTTLLKHTTNEIEVYLMELLKKDLKKFKDMKQVKMFMDTLQDSKVMLERIEKMIEHRADKIDSLGVENILDYNKLSKVKMKYVYIFSDEYSLFMAEDTDSEEENEQKDKILSVIKKIAKLGRSVGIFFISGLQRSTITEINSLVKSQMCRLSFAQLSQRDSENIIGITDAYGLKKQECILFTGNEYIHLKTPYIDNKMINETLGINQSIKEPTKEKTISGGWHIPSPSEWLQIRDTIPEVTYIKEEIKAPIGQLEAPKKQSRRKSGVIKLSEVLKNAK
jgi:hypothetical protein